MEFTERTALERGFARVFHDEVRPALIALESERVRRLNRTRRGVAIALGLGVALAGGVLALFGAETPATIGAVVLVLVGVVAALVIRGLHATAWTGSVAEAVMPAVCAHVGDISFDRHATAGFPVGEMQALGMVGSHDGVQLSDRLKGTYRGTSYVLAEARLTRRRRDSDGKTRNTTVFSGLLFAIDVPVPVPTPILITRDHGMIGNRLGSLFSGSKGRGMPRVEVDHPAFEAAFEVHAANPEAARAFLPVPFLENLLAIGQTEGGRKGARAMVAGFSGRSFYLALDRDGGFLKMGALTKPVTGMEDDLHAIFDDIDLVRRIIDRLHGVESAS